MSGTSAPRYTGTSVPARCPTRSGPLSAARSPVVFPEDADHRQDLDLGIGGQQHQRQRVIHAGVGVER